MHAGSVHSCWLMKMQVLKGFLYYNVNVVVHTYHCSYINTSPPIGSKCQNKLCPWTVDDVSIGKLT